MDKFIEGLVSSLFGIVVLVAFGVVIGAGWLIYKLCEAVLPPLFRELAKGCDVVARDLGIWWREVTWKQYVARLQRETMRQIDAARSEQVEACRQLVAEIERLERLPAPPTTVVRIAVRPQSEAE